MDEVGFAAVRVSRDDGIGVDDVQHLINVIKPLAISTGQLHTSPCLHLPPIDLLVLQGPSSREREPKPSLEGGFPLRCIQRLSFPSIATQRCPERDNWYTRGSYLLILSY